MKRVNKRTLQPNQLTPQIDNHTETVNADLLKDLLTLTETCLCNPWIKGFDIGTCECKQF